MLNNFRSTHSGFLLLEVMVGMAVFVLFITAVGMTMLYGQEGTIAAGDRARATYLAEQAMEAARAIRDQSFASLTAGQHGWRINNTVWSFTGSSVTFTGSYTTSLTVTTIASDAVGLTARTAWKHGYNRSGSIVLTGELTDWRSTRSVGNWSSLTVDGSYTPGGTPGFTDLEIFSGAYVFAAATSSPGIYVIDTTTTTAPARINSSFSLGYGAYDAVIRGNILFVATADPSQEIRAYRISSPSTFSAAQLLGFYNVPGSSRVRSLAMDGTTLYAGAAVNGTAGQDEFYAFRVSSGGTITLLDSVDDSADILDIAVSGTAAYLASTLDTGELRVANVESGSNVTILGGYNLSDRTLDAQSIMVSGTAAILGTLKGSSIQEVVMFHTENGGVPVPPPGPWYHEGSGSIVDIDTDPRQCIAFLASQSGRKALQVMNMRDTSTLAELTTYQSTSGLGNAVLYDMRRDRLLFLTDQSFFIFRPGTTTGTCP